MSSVIINQSDGEPEPHGPAVEGDNFWKDPAIQSQRSRWMKFEKPGDVCGPGTIKALGKRTFDAGTEDERTLPEVFFTEPDVASVTVGPWSLVRGLTEIRPRVGDRLTIEFVTTVGKSKMFKITLVRPDGETEVVDTRKYL